MQTRKTKRLSDVKQSGDDDNPPRIRIITRYKKDPERDQKSQRLLDEAVNIVQSALTGLDHSHIKRKLESRKYRSMVLIQNGVVIGVTTFRFHNKRKFAQLVYLAVSKNHRRNGYGRKMVNRLRRYLSKKNVPCVVTFADNSVAKTVYPSLGFKNVPKKDKENFTKYMKDIYVRVTLMYSDVNQTYSTPESTQDDEYDVEEILNKHVASDGTIFYQIKWKGYLESENTWEPQEHLSCDDLVREFNSKRLIENCD